MPSKSMSASKQRCDWGTRGNGIVRHQGETYENVIFVAGFSKAYSSLLSFLTLPTRLKDVLKVAAPPYLYSGPSPVASLATTIAGLHVNDRRGDRQRLEMHRKTARVLDRVHELGIYTSNPCRKTRPLPRRRPLPTRCPLPATTAST